MLAEMGGFVCAAFVLTAFLDGELGLGFDTEGIVELPASTGNPANVLDYVGIAGFVTLIVGSGFSNWKG